jgi:UDP-N-acetylmuramyl pentapeptide phosphotransferase/UDP-N-acetylglucosamine-1-phosphate transferase
MTVALWLLLAFLAFAGAVLYRWIWLRFARSGVTPKGYGGLLAVFLVWGATSSDVPHDLVGAYMVILVAAALYWIDDASGLTAKTRFSLQFISGVAIAYILAGNTGSAKLATVCLAAGILNIILTNVINFADGADLNLVATMMLTTAGAILVGSDAGFMRTSVLIVLAVVLSFALLNFRPKMLYFGDSGCFVFASFLTAMTVLYFREDGNTAAYVAIPIALPAYDALYVFVMRIRNREDLLTRNYLHLYQKLQSNYSDFFYLVPQFVNAVLVTSLALILQRAGLSPLLAVSLAGVAGTPILYAVARHRFIR